MKIKGYNLEAATEPVSVPKTACSITPTLTCARVTANPRSAVSYQVNFSFQGLYREVTMFTAFVAFPYEVLLNWKLLCRLKMKNIN
jgi:hypothetical protein